MLAVLRYTADSSYWSTEAYCRQQLLKYWGIQQLLKHWGILQTAVTEALRHTADSSYWSIEAYSSYWSTEVYCRQQLLKYWGIQQTAVTEVLRHTADSSYWSTEAYCRRLLLKMQVKHNTYWGIQCNCKVMQVKKVMFQRMGSVCITHPYRQRKHFDSKQFVECMLNTPAFILLCHTWGRI